MDETVRLCDLIHGIVESGDVICPEDGGAVFCYDLAAALIAKGVRLPREPGQREASEL